MQFSIVQYLLTAVCVISIINVLLIVKLGTSTTFSYVLRFFNGYLFIHASFVLIATQFFSNLTWLDRYAPFSLMYGPFLYFAFISVSNDSIPLKKILAHSLPFILCMLAFVHIIILKPNNFMFSFYKTLNITTVISFCVYTLLTMFLNTKPLNEQFKPRKLVMLGAIIILLFVSIIGIVAITSTKQIIAKPNAILLLRTMTYACMFISAAMVFRYKINIIFHKLNNADAVVPVNQTALKPAFNRIAKYEKSTLSNKQLDEYSKKLEKLMFSQRAYLATDLSLQKLAQLLRIPNHHLTQVLSLKIKMGFYDYVNGFRVQYACMLLENEPDVNLENIAERSGFNSKVSFNRHFKVILGCTPSNYRTQSKDFKDIQE